MKVSITQANLHKGLSVVGKIVGTRTTLPVLANVLLATDANRVRLSSTNLEIGINHWIGAKVETEGALTVPARLLSDYVASLNNDTLELNQEKQTLHIKNTQTESSINGIEASEFPSIPSIKKPATLKIEAKKLKNALSQVVGAASADDTRPILNGVYFYTENKNVVLVATDSYRLAEKIVPLEGKPAKDALKIVVPARTIQELLRMLDDQVDAVELVVEDNQVLFKFGDTELISRLIEGDFPDYRQLIPSTVVTEVKVPTAELLNITKLAALFARESGGSVTLRVDITKQQLQLQATASQVGDSLSSIKVGAKGEDVELALNSRYILDGLTNIGAPELKLDITGKINPCLFRPQGKNSDYLHLIMPLRG